MTNKASRHIAPAKRIINYKYDHTTFIILAAAVGKRMKTYGPKALLEYTQGTTILDHTLKTIYEVYPKADIIVVVGFEHQKFWHYKYKYPSIRLVNNTTHSTTNTLYSTHLGLDASVGQKIIVMHGDLIFAIAAIDNLTERGSKITMCKTMSKDSVGIAHQNNIITNISYGLNDKWGQITYFTGKEYQLLLQLLQNETDLQHMFLYEGIRYIIENGGKFRIHNQENVEIYDIDSHKDLLKTRELL